jgi:hypothetical protein
MSCLISPQSSANALIAKFVDPLLIKHENMALHDTLAETLHERVQELLEFQKTNPTVEEIYERFYDENVVVQENLNSPRVGRSTSIDRQKRMNANVQGIHEVKIGAVLIDNTGETNPLDGRSVLELHLELTTVDDDRMTLALSLINSTRS